MAHCGFHGEFEGNHCGCVDDGRHLGHEVCPTHHQSYSYGFGRREFCLACPASERFYQWMRWRGWVKRNYDARRAFAKRFGEEAARRGAA